ncbi:hypothetical protein NMY22_g18520 [Coprinellus aureogranulatus]|nr:hypothetical protein NMY22_g18520 [Coprinellus aureogranulatus]
MENGFSKTNGAGFDDQAQPGATNEPTPSTHTSPVDVIHFRCASGLAHLPHVCVTLSQYPPSLLPTTAGLYTPLGFTFLQHGSLSIPSHLVDRLSKAAQSKDVNGSILARVHEEIQVPVPRTTCRPLKLIPWVTIHNGRSRHHPSQSGSSRPYQQCCISPHFHFRTPSPSLAQLPLCVYSSCIKVSAARVQCIKNQHPPLTPIAGNISVVPKPFCDRRKYIEIATDRSELRRRYVKSPPSKIGSGDSGLMKAPDLI